MNRYFFFIIAALTMLSCSKDDDNMDDDDITVIPQPVFVDVTYQGSNATVSIPAEAKGVICSTGTASDVVLTLAPGDSTEYIYRIKGTSPSGSLTINSDYKLTMLLAGVNLTSTTATPAININCGKRISLILQEETENTLADNPTNPIKGAFYAKGHVEIEGGGTLNVEGKYHHAIAVKEYLRLKKTTGTINILGAAGDGIHCGKGQIDTPDDNYFRINGGTLNFHNVQGDLIDCDDYGNAYINGGTINLNVETSEGKGLKADSLIYMNGGTINLNVSGASAIGIQANYDAQLTGGTITGSVSGYSSTGIRGNNSKSSITVLNGGYLHLNGTSINLSVTGGGKTKAIDAETSADVTPGTVFINGTEYK